MLQQDLLADVPRARARDPQTSHEAARRIKDSGALGRQQRAVLDLVQRFPGHTAGELAARYSEEHGVEFTAWRFRFSRRLPELVPVHIRRGEMRACRALGTLQATWWPR